MKNSRKGARRDSARKRKKLLKNIFNCGIALSFFIIMVYLHYEYREEKITYNVKGHLYEYKFGQSLKDFIDDNGYPTKVAGYENKETQVHHLFFDKGPCFRIFTFKDNSLVEVLQGFHSEMLVQVLLQHWRCHDRCSLPGHEKHTER